MDARSVRTLGAGDTFGFLLGEWRLERTLTDRRLHETCVVSGTVTIRTCGSRDEMMAHYREVGILRIGSYRGTAERRLRFLRRQDGAVTMTFEDGRPFVTCDLRSGSCDAVHLCGEDRYEISWRVSTPEVIWEQWRVRGPYKDYEARGRLERLHATAAVREV